jgi:metal-responsive CopG/Arc/MetJ family transcriptional regulator
MQLPDEIIREYQATIGRNGGKSRSEAKQKAGKKSLTKARKVLKAKRRAERKSRNPGCIAQ